MLQDPKQKQSFEKDPDSDLYADLGEPPGEAGCNRRSLLGQTLTAAILVLRTPSWREILFTSSLLTLLSWAPNVLVGALGYQHGFHQSHAAFEVRGPVLCNWVWQIVSTFAEKFITQY